MPKTYEITIKQKAEISEARKANRDKDVEKRLRAVELRSKGNNCKEIASKVEAHPKVVSRWICSYAKSGLKGIMKSRRGGNRRNMTLEDETSLIAEFKEKAEKGQLVTVKEIKIAYCEKIGHTCGKGQIYRVLKRQEWRKVVPRKEHPNKASEASIDASKKLTIG